MIKIQIEMKEFANSELENLKKNYQINEKKIKLFLLPKRSCR